MKPKIWLQLQQTTLKFQRIRAQPTEPTGSLKSVAQWLRQRRTTQNRKLQNSARMAIRLCHFCYRWLAQSPGHSVLVENLSFAAGAL